MESSRLVGGPTVPVRAIESKLGSLYAALERVVDGHNGPRGRTTTAVPRAL